MGQKRLGDTRERDKMLAHVEAGLERSRSSVRVNWGNEEYEVRTEEFRKQLRNRAQKFDNTSLTKKKPKSTRSK